MGHLRRTFAAVAVLAAGTAPLSAMDGPTPGQANSAPPAASAQKDDKAASTVQKMLDTGVTAYNAGKIDQAIRAFDTAIGNGSLSSQQMAKALYYRGLSYRKKNKPALAIPDLTSAIWLNGGLTSAEQQEAMASRVAAYRDAGVSDVPEMARTAGLGGDAFGGSGWQTDMSGSPTTTSAPASSPPPPPASAPVSAPQSAAYVPARPPPPTETTSSSGSSGGVGGFFNSITNMFGGSSSSSSAQPTTASVEQPPPAPATSGWSQSTEIVTASPPAQAPAQVPVPVQQPAPSEPFATQTQVSAVAPPVVERAPPAAATGNYHVQVAAVRSRSEAAALSVRLLSQHGTEFGSRRPVVEETVIGSMGTFYRVSVGPYASEQEPQRLCGSLQTSGFDCLVISQ